MKAPKKPLSKKVISKAAIRCFSKFGSQRTSMADIATEAGVSRQSVYRFFEDRSALIQYILNDRISQLGEQLQDQFANFQSVEEALVHGSISSIRIGRKDSLLSEIVSNSSDHGLELFLLNGTDDIDRMMARNWNPILDQARAAGRIRAGISNNQILEWLRQIHALLIMRDDQDEEAQIALLRDFFVPSVLRDTPAKKTK